MIAATWVWVLLGVVFVFVAGLLLVVALGLTTLPGDFLRRAAQTGTPGRTEGGRELEEVPAASAEETAKVVDDEDA